MCAEQVSKIKEGHTSKDTMCMNSGKRGKNLKQDWLHAGALPADNRRWIFLI